MSASKAGAVELLREFARLRRGTGNMSVADAMNSEAHILNAASAVSELVEAAKSGVETLENLVAINRIPPNSKGLRDLRAAIAAFGEGK